MTREVFFLASVYHDAVETGSPYAEELRAQLDAEVEVAYVERRQVYRVARPYFVKAGDAYDYGDELTFDEESAEIENSVRFADACRHFSRTSRMPEWGPSDTKRSTIVSFDAVLKEFYSAEDIAAWVPTNENPFFGLLSKGTQTAVEENIAELAKSILELDTKPSRVFVNPATYELLKKVNETDEVEMRMRSYASVVTDPHCPPNRAYLITAQREIGAVLENMHHEIAMDLFRGDDNE